MCQLHLLLTMHAPPSLLFVTFLIQVLLSNTVIANWHTLPYLTLPFYLRGGCLPEQAPSEEVTVRAQCATPTHHKVSKTS